MPVLIICISAGIAFLLVFLRACLRETRPKGPPCVFLLELPPASDSEDWRARAAGGQG